MAKHNKTNIPAVAHCASLAARALARLEKEAGAVLASEDERHERGLQLVSSKEGFSAIIKHGKTMIQIEGNSFAVTQSD